MPRLLPSILTLSQPAATNSNAELECGAVGTARSRAPHVDPDLSIHVLRSSTACIRCIRSRYRVGRCRARACWPGWQGRPGPQLPRGARAGGGALSTGTLLRHNKPSRNTPVTSPESLSSHLPPPERRRRRRRRQGSARPVAQANTHVSQRDTRFAGKDSTRFGSCDTWSSIGKLVSSNNVRMSW